MKQLISIISILIIIYGNSYLFLETEFKSKLGPEWIAFPTSILIGAIFIIIGIIMLNYGFDEEEEEEE